MQPSGPIPVEARPLPPSAEVGAPRNLIVFGIVFALAGIVLEGVGYAIFVIVSGPAQPSGNSRLLVDILYGSQSAGLVFVGIGMFLIFFGASRLRPASKPWTTVAAIVLLLTGLVGGILRASFYLIITGVIAGPPGTSMTTMIELTNEVSGAVSLLGSVALIAGLFGLTRS